MNRRSFFTRAAATALALLVAPAALLAARTTEKLKPPLRGRHYGLWTIGGEVYHESAHCKDLWILSDGFDRFGDPVGARRSTLEVSEMLHPSIYKAGDE